MLKENIGEDSYVGLETELKYEEFQKQLKTFQPAFTCSKLTMETLEQGKKYVQN